MASRQGGKAPRETLELTEMLVLHGDSLRGSDAEKEAKLEKIRTALREREIDFVDQPEAFEIWVGTQDRDTVVKLLEEMGYQTDVFQI